MFDFALNPKDTSSFFTVGSDQCLLKLSVGKKEQIHLEVMEKHQLSKKFDHLKVCTWRSDIQVLWNEDNFCVHNGEAE